MDDYPEYIWTAKVVSFLFVDYMVGCDVAGVTAEGLLPPVRPAQDAGEQAAHPREGQQTGKLL